MTRGRFLRRHTVAVRFAGVFVVFGALPFNSWADSIITDLSELPGSAFGTYGLLVAGGSHNLQLTSDTTLYANVAVGSPISLQGGNDTIHGDLDFAGSSNGLASLTVTGSIATSSALAAAAILDAESLSSSYSAVAGVSLSANTLNVATTPGAAYNGNANEHLYDVATSFNGALSITAAADQFVILNVGKGSGSNWSLGPVALAGGITSDHVLINVLTTGQLSSSNAHSQTVNAIVIDNAGKVNLDNFTLDGRLFCSTAYNDCQVVSNARIYSTVNAGVTSPEPGSMLLTGAGLLLGLALCRCRSRAGEPFHLEGQP